MDREDGEIGGRADRGIGGDERIGDRGGDRGQGTGDRQSGLAFLLQLCTVGFACSFPCISQFGDQHLTAGLSLKSI